MSRVVSIVSDALTETTELNLWLRPNIVDELDPDPLVGYTNYSINWTWASQDEQVDCCARKRKPVSEDVEPVTYRIVLVSAPALLGSISDDMNQSGLTPPTCTLPTKRTRSGTLRNNEKIAPPEDKLTSDKPAGLWTLDGRPFDNCGVVMVRPEPYDETRTDPRTIKGYMSMCQFCGIGSEDLHTCIRCKHQLPANVHTVKDPWHFKPAFDELVCRAASRVPSGRTRRPNLQRAVKGRRRKHVLPPDNQDQVESNVPNETPVVCGPGPVG